MIAPIAHGGHWLINVLYLVPLVIIIATLGWQSVKDSAGARSMFSSPHAAHRTWETSALVRLQRITTALARHDLRLTLVGVEAELRTAIEQRISSSSARPADRF